MTKLEEIKEKFMTSLKLKELDMNANLKDLGLDSLDVVEMLLELEDEYDIHFDDADMADFKTVGDLFASIEKQVK